MIYKWGYRKSFSYCPRLDSHSANVSTTNFLLVGGPVLDCIHVLIYRLKHDFSCQEISQRVFHMYKLSNRPELVVLEGQLQSLMKTHKTSLIFLGSSDSCAASPGFSLVFHATQQSHYKQTCVQYYRATPTAGGL